MAFEMLGVITLRAQIEMVCSSACVWNPPATPGSTVMIDTDVIRKVDFS